MNWILFGVAVWILVGWTTAIFSIRQDLEVGLSITVRDLLACVFIGGLLGLFFTILFIKDTYIGDVKDYTKTILNKVIIKSKKGG